MTIETSLLISGISVAFAVFAGIIAIRRNDRKDVERKAIQSATVNVKLDTIGGDVAEIKDDVKGIITDVKTLTERVVAVEQSAKQAHKRLDEHITKGAD